MATPAITPLPKPPGFQEDSNWKEDAPAQQQDASGWTENDQLPSLSGGAPDLAAHNVVPTIWNVARGVYRDAQQNPQGYMAGGASALLKEFPTPVRAALVGGVGAASQLGVEGAKWLKGDPTKAGPIDILQNMRDQGLRQGGLEFGVGKLAEAITPAKLIASQIGDKIIGQYPHIPETMLKYGASPTAGGIRKLQTEIDAIEAGVEDIIKSKPNGTISMDRALAPVKELKNQAVQQLTGFPVPNAHDAPSKLVELADEHIGEMTAQHPQSVPLSNLKSIKKHLREKAGEYGRQGGPGSTDAERLRKLTISGINDAMVDATGDPQLKNMLLEEARIVEARNAIEASLPNKRSMLPPGVTRPLVGATLGAAGGAAAHGNDYRDPVSTTIGVLGGAAAGAALSPGNIARVIAQIQRVPGAGQAVQLPARVALGRELGNTAIWKKYQDYLDKKKPDDK